MFGTHEYRSIAVQVRNAINRKVAALCCIEGGAAEPNLAFLEWRCSSETSEEGDEKY
jgi:hypothetical protein